MNKHDASKRKFIKVAAYVAPAILTLKAVPSYASAGSVRGDGGYDGRRSRGSWGGGSHHRRRG